MDILILLVKYFVRARMWDKYTLVIIGEHPYFFYAGLTTCNLLPLNLTHRRNKNETHFINSILTFFFKYHIVTAY